MQLKPIEVYPEETTEPVAPPLFEKTVPPVPQPVAKQRAAKAAFGLMGDAAVLESAIINGDEQRHRQAAADKLSFERMQEQNNMIKDYMSSYEGTPRPEDVELIQGLATPQRVNPDTVFEAQYARQFMNTALVSLGDNSSFTKAYSEDPEGTMELVNQADWQLQRKELIQKKLEQLEVQRNSDGIQRTVEDTIETFIPFYSWASQSRAVEGAEADGFWQNTNFRQQRDYLLTLPPDQFNAEFSKAVDTIAESNIYEAIEFAQNMAGYSTSKQALTTLFNIADVADLPLLGAGSLAVKGAKAGARKAAGKASISNPKGWETGNGSPVVGGTLEPSISRGQGITNPNAEEIKIVARANKPYQTEGNQYRLVPINESNYDQYIAPLSDTKSTLSEYLKRTKNQYSYVLLRKQPDTDWEVSQVGDKKGLIDYFNEDSRKGWMQQVDDFDAEDAKTFRNLGDEEVEALINSPKTEIPTYTAKWKTATTNGTISGIKTPEEAYELAAKQGEVVSVVERTRRTSPKTELATTLVDTLQAAGKRNTTTEEVVASTGDLSKAAEVQALKQTKERLLGQDTALQSRSLIKTVSASLLDPTGYARGAMRLAQGKANDLVKEIAVLNNKLLSTVNELNTVNRLTPEAEMAALEKAKEVLYTRYGSIQDSVLDVASAPITYTKLPPKWVKTPDGGKRPVNAVYSKEENRIFINEDGLRKDFEAKAWTKDFPEDAFQTADEYIAFRKRQEQLRTIQKPKKNETTEQYENRIKELALKRESPIIGDKFVRSSDNPITNTASVHIQLGRPNKELFKNKTQAVLHAVDMYKLPKNSFTIQKQGEGYYIDIKKDVDETGDTARALLVTTDNKTPDGIVNTFLSWATRGFNPRTPEDRLSKLHRENRHAYTHVVQRINELVRETAESIGTISDKEKKGLERVLNANRDHPNADGTRGAYHKTIGQFEQGYFNLNQVYPSEQATKAYFAAISLNDLDYVLRNLGIYRDKARQGRENFTFKFKKVDETGAQVNANTPMFEGVVVDKLPDPAQENAGIAIYNNGSLNFSFMRSGNLTDANKKYLDDLLQNQGYKIVQVARPKVKPLQDVSGIKDVVNFVIVKNYDASPLAWKQIPYRPGGHVLYDEEFFVKQAKLTDSSYGTKVYEGETTVLTFTTEAEAKKFTPRVEKARQLLDSPDLDDYVIKNLPWTPEEFKKFFEEGVDQHGNPTPPKLDRNEPIVYVKKGEGVNDKYRDALKSRYANLEDMVDSGYNLDRDIDKKFAGERNDNTSTIQETGTEESPLYKLVAPRLIDGMTSLNNATSNIIRSRAMADYQHYAIENFIEEFGDTTRLSKQELRKNPLYYLYNPPWKDPTAMTEFGKLQAAQSYQRAVLHLIGAQDETSGGLQWMQNKLLDSVYNKTGAKGADFVADHMLGKITDPFRYARAIAFHSKLGLGNVVQGFLQSQGLFHVLAIAPVEGLKGFAAAPLMRYLASTENPKVFEHFANIATKFGWTKEDFLESLQQMELTGLRHVEGDTAVLDDMRPPDFVSTGKVGRGAAKVLDWGTIFFKEPERIIRFTSWNTAYREWKKANPNTPIGSRERNKILRRANDLSVNMTRASNASWQKGVMSVPTQFFAYQARLTEQMLGKRLTWAEKARVFAMYSALYGVPTATGAVVGVWPMADKIRTHMLNNGISVEGAAVEAVLDGIPSMMLEMLGGPDLDVGGRYGPGGLDIFRDLFVTGDKDFIDLITGASGGIISDMYKSASPLIAAVGSVFDTDADDEYPFILQDLIDTTRNISSVNNAAKMFYAINYGKYISKNEVKMDDITTPEAIFMGITGLSPQRMNDAFLMIASNKEQQEIKKAAIQEAVKNLKRAIEVQLTNPEEATKFRKAARMHVIGADLQPYEYAEVIQQLYKGNTDLVDKIMKEFADTKAPRSQREQRMEQYRNREQN